tara:strand:+ start:121 stop:339 length:219 start_codon:yes stop_codon:yes gene_type:complete
LKPISREEFSELKVNVKAMEPASHIHFTTYFMDRFMYSFNKLLEIQEAIANDEYIEAGNLSDKYQIGINDHA